MSSGSHEGSRLSLWRAVAKELGAEMDYTDDRHASGRSEIINMRVPHKHWCIDFQCEGKRSSDGKAEGRSRVRCPIVNPRHFRFHLYEEKLQDRFRKIVGLQDILIGDTDLDRRFIIQANSEAHIQELMSAESVRKAFDNPHIEHLRIIDDELNNPEPLPAHMDYLYGATQDRMSNRAEIIAHFELFSATLEELLKLGHIEPDQE